nr:hypothetical protein [bacterium]
MASITLPAGSYNSGYYRYNREGGSWQAPYGTPTGIFAGRESSGTTYRAYIRIPGQTALSGATLQAITLNFKRIDTYSSTVTWAIGIMDSAPGVTVSASNFRATIDASCSIAASASKSISITPAAWGDPTTDKYIVFVAASSSGYSYAKIAANSSAYPTVAISYATYPVLTTPSVAAVGTVTTDSKTLSWTAARDSAGLVSASQITYTVQLSTNGGSTYSGITTTAAGAASYAANFRTLLGQKSGQYYYNASCYVRVRANVTYGGSTYTSAWGTSAKFAIDYRVVPGAPGAPAPSKAAPYEGEAITVTIARPGAYNAYNAAGAVMNLTYKLVLVSSGAVLASKTQAATETSCAISYTVGSLTSGGNLSSKLRACVVDAAGQASANSAETAITINRYRAPIIAIDRIDRDETAATVHISIRDTGYGAQASTQIASVEYRLDDGAWAAATLDSWSGMANSFSISGLASGTRYAIQVRCTNTVPADTSLAAKTSAAYTGTVLEYVPAFFVFRDSGTGQTGVGVNSLIVGQDYGISVADGQLVTDIAKIGTDYMDQYRTDTYGSVESILEMLYAATPDFATKRFQISVIQSDQTLEGGLWDVTMHRTNEKYGVVTAISYGTPVARKLSRCISDGVWYPWAWENPPMAANVEYYTTKKWQGSVVYTKSISVGYLPNATTKTVAHNIASVGKMLSMCLAPQSHAAALAKYPGIASYYADATNMVVSTTTNLSSIQAFAVLEYTKTS